MIPTLPPLLSANRNLIPRVRAAATMTVRSPPLMMSISRRTMPRPLYTVQLALPMFCPNRTGFGARHLEVGRILIHGVGAEVEVSAHGQVRRITVKSTVTPMNHPS